jgi:hypothetical protein
MNIDELLELSVSDTVRFHNQLNPAFWQNQDHNKIILKEPKVYTEPQSVCNWFFTHSK